MFTAIMYLYLLDSKKVHQPATYLNIHTFNHDKH